MEALESMLRAKEEELAGRRRRVARAAETEKLEADAASSDDARARISRLEKSLMDLVALDAANSKAERARRVRRLKSELEASLVGQARPSRQVDAARESERDDEKYEETKAAASDGCDALVN